MSYIKEYILYGSIFMKKNMVSLQISLTLMTLNSISLLQLLKTTSTMLDISDEGRHFCITKKLREKAFSPIKYSLFLINNKPYFNEFEENPFYALVAETFLK